MTNTPLQESDLHRLATAAAWRVALAEAGQESSLDFEAWLASDSANEAAWAQVQAPWRHMGEHATAPEALAAREEVLQYVRKEQQQRRSTKRQWLGPRMVASAAVAFAVLTVVAIGAWDATRADVYQTAFGERRSITLADGSSVVLDSAALLKVRYKKDARDLELVRGQAHFSVARDVARPFSVHARDRVVVATGTSFNVDLLGSQVIVTLIEGKVNVLKAEAASWPLPWRRPAQTVVARLNAGQQFVLVKSPASAHAVAPAVERIANTNLERTTAWESGQLVFENEPLGSVAERVGRYGAVPLVVKGPAVNLRISGVFNSGDIDAFLDAVQRSLPVRAEHVDGQIVLKINGP